MTYNTHIPCHWIQILSNRWDSQSTWQCCKRKHNEKSFRFKWPEMDSLNTKRNVKQKWGKRKRNNVLLKTSLTFSLTWKRRIKLAAIFAERPKKQIQNHIETCRNSYHIEASQLIYIVNKFTGSVWGLFLMKSFWNRLLPFLSPVVEKNSKYTCNG